MRSNLSYKKEIVGVFSAAVEVRHKSRDEFVSVEALVDTGAIYTMLPEDLLEPLGIERLDSDIFEPANGNLVEYAIEDAIVRPGGRTRTAPVVFDRPGNTPLLGATTLELLRLLEDPIEQRLIPTPPIKARPF